MRTVDEVMQKLREGHAVRPAYIAARGSATEEVLLTLARYGYALANPMSIGDGSFCTSSLPGAPGPFCLFRNTRGVMDA